MHLDDWRPHNDWVVMFVARVLMPVAIRNYTTGGGDERDGAGR